MDICISKTMTIKGYLYNIVKNNNTFHELATVLFKIALIREQLQISLTITNVIGY